MNKLLKDKKKLAVVVVAVVLVLGVVLFFAFGRGSNQVTNNQDGDQVSNIPTISAEELGLSLRLSANGRQVVVTVANTDDISAIGYTLSYIAKGDVPRGVLGEMDLTKKPVTHTIDLGTCSDVCHYDEDVTDIKIILKVTKNDGKVYQAEKALEE